MMCFYNDDYDWYAQIIDMQFVRSEKHRWCVECGEAIQVGDWCRLLYQQEHEMCQLCEDHESPDYDEEADHAGCKHEYGETYRAATCRGCCLILESIWDLEAKEGCPEYARQPDTGELRDELCQDTTRSGQGKYVEHALAMFPELVSHPILDYVTEP